MPLVGTMPVPDITTTDTCAYVAAAGLHRRLHRYHHRLPLQ